MNEASFPVITDVMTAAFLYTAFKQHGLGDVCIIRVDRVTFNSIPKDGIFGSGLYCPVEMELIVKPLKRTMFPVYVS